MSNPHLDERIAARAAQWLTLDFLLACSFTALGTLLSTSTLECDHHHHSNTLGELSLPCPAICIALHVHACCAHTIYNLGMPYPNNTHLGDHCFFSPVSRSAAITSLRLFRTAPSAIDGGIRKPLERNGMRALIVALITNELVSG
ncbi:hypothetical protein DE146DRAFT_462347 [Phaeosphaeria sp. MPI-PUGE-AT-0046c]|nr:hypothetical protein DE146DRAFT_462347 [Phaeosphaeria sp. MPI-PUGE-AT-0046c]